MRRKSAQNAATQQQATAAEQQAMVDQAAAQAAAQVQAQQAAAAAAPVAAPQPDRLTRIKELGAMRDAGLLTEDEFAAEKAKILSS